MDKKKTNKRISIQIATRDRPSELGILLQSLRTQTYKEWDLVIVDDGTMNIMATAYIPLLLNRMKMEGHCVNIIKNDLHIGVCHCRNLAVEKDYFDNDYIARLDDDVIIEHDYLEKLIKVINAGYDIASGVTPGMSYPTIERKTSHVKQFINKKEFDKEGTLTRHDDECAYGYEEETITPTHEFRSNALMKKEVANKISYPDNLSPVGFREEGFFSTKAIIEGYKIGVITSAIAWHFQTPSGGCKHPDYGGKVQSDNNYFVKWNKQLFVKHGDFLKKYYDEATL